MIARYGYFPYLCRTIINNSNNHLILFNMKSDSRASKISNIVNSTLFDPMEVGIELTTDHRYLQNEEFKTFLHFAGQLARNYEKGLYDDRNEFACKSALAMIEGLEKAGLYDRKYWYARYDEMLEKSY